MFRIFIFSIIILMSFGCRKSSFMLPEEKPVNTITDTEGKGIGTRTLKKGEKYTIEGLVYVNDGQVLTIEPGAVIKFNRGKGIYASALVIARGGKIIADGTADDPIIFTSIDDDLKGSVKTSQKGLWGGIIILGNAPIDIASGEAHIEGIVESELRGSFGGNNPEDNSGIFKYISIRYPGTNIGENNEINGLTLGGVGRGTIIENIEIVSSADDGIEIFGGNADLKNVIVAYANDDSFDFDMGYCGRMQFLLAIQDTDQGDAFFEISEYEDLIDKFPEIRNVTAIGRGNKILSPMLKFQDRGGAFFYNSIFINQGKGVVVQYEPSSSSYHKWKNNRLKVENNMFYNVGDNTTSSCIMGEALHTSLPADINKELSDYFTAKKNTIFNPGIEIKDRAVYIFPTVVFENLAPVTDRWFSEVKYKGAFGSTNWALKWSYVSSSGILVN